MSEPAFQDASASSRDQLTESISSGIERQRRMVRSIFEEDQRDQRSALTAANTYQDQQQRQSNAALMDQMKAEDADAYSYLDSQGNLLSALTDEQRSRLERDKQVELQQKQKQEAAEFRMRDLDRQMKTIGDQKLKDKDREDQVKNLEQKRQGLAMYEQDIRDGRAKYDDVRETMDAIRKEADSYEAAIAKDDEYRNQYNALEEEKRKQEDIKANKPEGINTVIPTDPDERKAYIDSYNTRVTRLSNAQKLINENAKEQQDLYQQEVAELNKQYQARLGLGLSPAGIEEQKRLYGEKIAEANKKFLQNRFDYDRNIKTIADEGREINILAPYVGSAITAHNTWVDEEKKVAEQRRADGIKAILENNAQNMADMSMVSKEAASILKANNDLLQNPLPPEATKEQIEERQKQIYDNEKAAQNLYRQEIEKQQKVNADIASVLENAHTKEYFQELAKKGYKYQKSEHDPGRSEFLMPTGREANKMKPLQDSESVLENLWIPLANAAKNIEEVRDTGIKRLARTISGKTHQSNDTISMLQLRYTDEQIQTALNEIMLENKEWEEGEKSRTLWGGNVYINPSLNIVDRDVYRGAVESSTAPQYMKQYLLSDEGMNNMREEYALQRITDNELYLMSGGQLVQQARNMPSFAEWQKQYYQGKTEQTSLPDQFEQYQKHYGPGNRSGLTSIIDTLNRPQQALNYGGAKALGAVAGIATLAEIPGALSVAEYLQKYQDANKSMRANAMGGKIPYLTPVVDTILEEAPSLALTLAPGAGAAGATSSVLQQAVKHGGAAVAKTAAKYATIATRAGGVVGSAVGGGLQSAGLSWHQYYQTAYNAEKKRLGRDLTEDEKNELVASNDVRGKAMVAGVITTGMMLAFGAAGGTIESAALKALSGKPIANYTIRDLVRSFGGKYTAKEIVGRTWKAIGSVAKPMGLEGAEEFSDEFLQTVTLNENASLQDALSAGLEAGKAGLILGGAFASVASASQTGIKNVDATNVQSAMNALSEATGRNYQQAEVESGLQLVNYQPGRGAGDSNVAIDRLQVAIDTNNDLNKRYNAAQTKLEQATNSQNKADVQRAKQEIQDINQARAIIKIANGYQLADLTRSEQTAFKANLLDGSAAYTQDANGNIIISDSAINMVARLSPSAASKLIGLSEAGRMEQIKQQEAAAAAGTTTQAPAATTQAPATTTQAPANAATPQAFTRKGGEGFANEKGVKAALTRAKLNPADYDIVPNPSGSGFVAMPKAQASTSPAQTASTQTGAAPSGGNITFRTNVRTATGTMRPIAVEAKSAQEAQQLIMSQLQAGETLPADLTQQLQSAEAAAQATAQAPAANTQFQRTGNVSPNVNVSGVEQAVGSMFTSVQEATPDQAASMSGDYAIDANGGLVLRPGLSPKKQRKAVIDSLSERAAQASLNEQEAKTLYASLPANLRILVKQRAKKKLGADLNDSQVAQYMVSNLMKDKLLSSSLTNALKGGDRKLISSALKFLRKFVNNIRTLMQGADRTAQEELRQVETYALALLKEATSAKALLKLGIVLPETRIDTTEKATLPANIIPMKGGFKVVLPTQVKNSKGQIENEFVTVKTVQEALLINSTKYKKRFANEARTASARAVIAGKKTREDVEAEITAVDRIVSVASNRLGINSDSLYAMVRTSLIGARENAIANSLEQSLQQSDTQGVSNANRAIAIEVIRKLNQAGEELFSRNSIAESARKAILANKAATAFTELVANGDATALAAARAMHGKIDFLNAFGDQASKDLSSKINDILEQKRNATEEVAAIEAQAIADGRQKLSAEESKAKMDALDNIKSLDSSLDDLLYEVNNQYRIQLGQESKFSGYNVPILDKIGNVVASSIGLNADSNASTLMHEFVHVLQSLQDPNTGLQILDAVLGEKGVFAMKKWISKNYPSAAEGSYDYNEAMAEGMEAYLKQGGLIVDTDPAVSKAFAQLSASIAKVHATAKKMPGYNIDRDAIALFDQLFTIDPVMDASAQARNGSIYQMQERIINNTQILAGYIVPPAMGGNAQVGFSKKKAAEQLAQKMGNNAVAFQHEGKYYAGKPYPRSLNTRLDNNAAALQGIQNEQASNIRLQQVTTDTQGLDQETGSKIRRGEFPINPALAKWHRPSANASQQGDIRKPGKSEIEYSKALLAAKAAHKKGGAVSPVSPEDMLDTEMYMLADGLGGVAIDQDGNLFAVFKHPDSKEDMRALLEALGTHHPYLSTLDCYDTGGYLPNLYHRTMGFVPVSKVAFNAEFAPDGYNAEELGTPDVLLMARMRGDQLRNNAYNNYQDIQDSVPTLDTWEEAWAYRANALKGIDGVQNFIVDNNMSVYENALDAARSYEAQIRFQRNAQGSQAYSVSTGDTSTRSEAGGLQDGRGVARSKGWIPSEDSPYIPTEKPKLKGLPSKVKVNDQIIEFGPFETARKAAENYMKSAGLPYNPPTTYAKVDEARAARVADAYDQMKHDPQNQEVKAAYQAMIDETLAQYEALKKTGIKILPMIDSSDYYGNPREAILDVVKNNRMYFFRTDDGFGSSELDVSDNPLLAETGEVINGHKMLVNDVFRVVHDYFGHIKEGVGFRADGEENAWRSHSSMYSPLARRAMTSETRGQNSWVNYGPHAEHNRTASQEDTIYADQKVGLLPEWVMYDGASDSPSQVQFQSQSEKSLGTSNNFKQYFDTKFRKAFRYIGVDVANIPTGYTAKLEIDSQQGAQVKFNANDMSSYSIEEVDAIIREEMIHAASWSVITENESKPYAKYQAYVDYHQQLYDMMSPAEIAAVKKFYKGAESKYAIAAEFKRISIQNMLYGNVTELTGKKPTSKAYQKIVSLLKDLISYFSSKLKGADPEQKRIFRETVDLVKDVERSIIKDKSAIQFQSNSKAFKDMVAKKMHQPKKSMKMTEAQEDMEIGLLTPEFFNHVKPEAGNFTKLTDNNSGDLSNQYTFMYSSKDNTFGLHYDADDDTWIATPLNNLGVPNISFGKPFVKGFLYNTYFELDSVEVADVAKELNEYDQDNYTTKLLPNHPDYNAGGNVQLQSNLQNGEFIEQDTKAKVQPGKRVGSSNPTAKRSTGKGDDGEHNISLARLREVNPLAYRKNALLLSEYAVLGNIGNRSFRQVRSLLIEARNSEFELDEARKVNNTARDKVKKAIQARMLQAAKAKGIKRQFAQKAKAEDVDNAIKVAPKGMGALVVEARKAQMGLDKALAKKNQKRKLADDKLDEVEKNIKAFTVNDAEVIYDAYVNATESNLLELINLMPGYIRTVAKLWYDGANIIANKFGNAYGVSREQASAVLAVFSPQKDWFQNVSLAERMMDTWVNKQDFVWTAEMSKRFVMRAGEPQPKMERADDGTMTEKTDPELESEFNPEGFIYDNNAIPIGINPDGSRIWQNFDKSQALKNIAMAKEFNAKAEGKMSLRQMEGVEQAWFIRMYSEVYHSPNYAVVGPDGSFGDFAMNSKGDKRLPVGWGGYSVTTKAIEIMKANPSDQQKIISDQLGTQHKVRSFYNNIADPSSARDLNGVNRIYGDVTMDTHAIAALLWLPLSGASREVSQNFGSGNTKNDSTAGIKGTYAANAEAYIRAAEKFGLLPREVQSITWEAVRMLFPAKFKSNAQNVKATRKIWNDYSNGTITAEQAREQIWELSPASKDSSGKRRSLEEAKTDDEGVGIPQWWKAIVQERRVYAEPRVSNDQALVSEGGGTRGLGSRDGDGGLGAVYTGRDRSGLFSIPSGQGGIRGGGLRGGDGLESNPNVQFQGASTQNIVLESGKRKPRQYTIEGQQYTAEQLQSLYEQLPPEEQKVALADAIKRMLERVSMLSAAIERKARPRVTGKANLLLRLTREAASRKIPANVAKEVIGFVNSINDYLLDDVAMSMTVKPVYSSYNFTQNLLTMSFDQLSRLDEKDQTRVYTHEFWHSLSRYLPQKEYNKMLAEYREQVSEYVGNNPWYYAFVGRMELTEAEYIDYAEFYPDKAAQYLREAVDPKTGEKTYGILYTENNYRYSMFDEWFAEEMMDLVREKMDLESTKPKNVMQWMARTMKAFNNWMVRKLGLNPYEDFYNMVRDPSVRLVNARPNTNLLPRGQKYRPKRIKESGKTVPLYGKEQMDNADIYRPFAKDPLDLYNVQFQGANIPKKIVQEFAPRTSEEMKARDRGLANKSNQRNPILTVAAVRLHNKQITIEQYAQLVDLIDPYVIKGAEPIPSDDKIKQYIAEDKKGKVGLRDKDGNYRLTKGSLYEFRIDIPTYNASAKEGDAVYAITAHEPVADESKEVGKVVSFTGIAKVNNAKFMTRVMREGGAITIASGSGKFRLATVKGLYEQITELPSDINNPKVWTEVSYNPIRSSLFRDVRSRRPIKSAASAIMIGSRVFVKNPFYDPNPPKGLIGSDLNFQRKSSQTTQEGAARAASRMKNTPAGDQQSKWQNRDQFDPNGAKVVTGDTSRANISEDQPIRNAYDVSQEIYNENFVQQNWNSWMQEANNILASTPKQDIELQIFQAAEGTGNAGTPGFQIAAKRVVADVLQRAMASGNQADIDYALRLSQAEQEMRAEIARSMTAMRDPFMNPRQRAAYALGTSISNAPAGQVGALKNKHNAKDGVVPKENKEAYEADLRKLQKDRIKKAKEALADAGINFDDVFNSANVGAGIDTTIDKESLANLTDKQQSVVIMHREGASEKDITAATGVSPEGQKEAINKYRQALEARVTELVKQGYTVNTMNDYAQGNPPPEGEATPTATPAATPVATPAATPAAAPTTPAEIATRVEEIVETSFLGQTQGKTPFNINNPTHVMLAAKAINSIDLDWIHRTTGTWYANVFSAKTVLINMLSLPFAGYRMFAERAANSLVNTIANNPEAKSFGEFKYISRGLKQYYKMALWQAYVAFDTEQAYFSTFARGEGDPFKAMAGESNEEVRGYQSGHILDYIDMGLKKIGIKAARPSLVRRAVGQRGSKSEISAGKTARGVLRFNLGVDEFMRFITAGGEIGAIAYRLGTAKGLKGAELEKFIFSEMTVQGSSSWEMAAEEADISVLTRELPTPKRSSISGISDLVASIANGLDKTMKDWEKSLKSEKTVYQVTSTGMSRLGNVARIDAMRAAMALTRVTLMPFTRVLMNIMREGYQRVPNPFSLAWSAAKVAKYAATSRGKSNPEAAKAIDTLGKQIISFAVAAAIFDMIEGDDDDKKKPILITGSMKKFGEGAQSERDAAYREGMGPYRIRVGDKTFFYGNIDPLAVVLGTTTDLIREYKKMKRGEKSLSESAVTLVADTLIGQMTDKTMLRGMNDAMMQATGRGNVKQYAARQLATFLVPNVLRQPLRDTNPYQDSRITNEGLQGFKEALLYELYPNSREKLQSNFPRNPVSPPADRDAYGEKIAKPSGGNIMSDWMLREMPYTPNRYDEMVRRERKLYPEREDIKMPGDLSTSFVYDNPKTGGKERLKLTPVQYEILQNIYRNVFRQTRAGVTNAEGLEKAKREASDTAWEIAKANPRFALESKKTSDKKK